MKVGETIGDHLPDIFYTGEEGRSKEENVEEEPEDQPEEEKEEEEENSSSSSSSYEEDYDPWDPPRKKVGEDLKESRMKKVKRFLDMVKHRRVNALLHLK